MSIKNDECKNTGGYLMYQSEEREKYIKKLDSQICGMKKLLDGKFSDVISGTKIDEIKKLQKKAETLRKKLAENEFEIAIIGLEKAGKSTFANALMGNNILPSMDARCTYTSTSIRYGSEDYAEIVYYTREEFSKKFTDNLKTMGIEHADNLDYSVISLSEYRNYFENLPDTSKNYYRATVNEDVENILEHKDTLINYIGSPMKIYRGSEQLESEEFKNFIQNPAYAVAVKEITIHSSKLIDMPNAVLYDVPGFDSPTQIHREQTIQMMATADVIILIANAGKPSITGPQVQIFEGEVDRDGIPFNEKIFVFGNKADTANDALETNVRVLKKQLDKYRIVRHELIDGRLVVGSARAKLEAENKLPDMGVYDNLKSKGIENGIDEIHKKLEDYNNTERFETLKKRVNRIYAELEECLAPELETLSDKTDGGLNISEISKIVITLLTDSQKKIKKELEKLHAHLPEDFEKLPLSEKFYNLINAVNSENYGVNEEEKEEAFNAVGTTGKNIALDEFERELRKKKYSQIYTLFIRTIVDLVIETHNEYDKKIEDIFLDALSVTSVHPYYDELKEKIHTYLNSINSEGKEGYYRSLSERFSTDLFETLIRPNFGGRDRWSAYEDRKLNLYSLGIFHTERDVLLPNDRQPMLYSILFHDQKGKSDSDGYVDLMLDVISKYVPEYDKQLLSNQLRPVLIKIAASKKEKSEDYIKKICNRFSTKSDDFVNSLLRFLELELDSDDEDGKTTTVDYGSEEITQDYYSERCRAENLNSNSVDVVCDHLDKDIDILGELLLKAAIPAIQIDKAFVYYEINSIENILHSIEPENENYIYGEFVEQNTAKIECGKLTNIEVEEKKRRLRQEICSEIQIILNDVKNFEDN